MLLVKCLWFSSRVLDLSLSIYVVAVVVTAAAAVVVLYIFTSCVLSHRFHSFVLGRLYFILHFISYRFYYQFVPMPRSPILLILVVGRLGLAAFKTASEIPSRPQLAWTLFCIFYFRRECEDD